MAMKQGDEESLKSYSSHFNLAVLEVPEAEAQLKTLAFIRGLMGGSFFDNLHTNLPRDYEELSERIPRYIQLEKARAARRSELDKNKAKKTRPEVPIGARYPQRGMPPRVPPSVPNTAFRSQFPGLKADISAIAKEEGFTPLNRLAETIFNEIKHEPFLHPPAGYHPGPPVGTPGQSVCKYHNAYGHCTDRCPALMEALEDLVRQGRLNGYVRRESDDRGRDGANRRRDQLPPLPKPPVRRQVQMIISSDDNRVSNRTRRNVIRASRAEKLPVMTVNKSTETIDAPITFGPADIRPLNVPHEDALVYSIGIGDCLVHRMFVGTGSAVNIIYKKALEKTGLEAKIRPTFGPVYSFSGEAVMPWGVVDLSLTLGSISAQRTMMMEFLVMDLPNVAYNGILGRPTLTSFRAVVSMYYLKLKFPVPGGFGEVYGNQISTKGSYVKAITQAPGENGRSEPHSKKGGSKRKRGKTSEISKPSNEKEGVDAEPVDIEKMPLVVPSEQCASIELVPGK